MSADARVTVRRVRVEEWVTYRSLRLRALTEDPGAFGSTLERERPFPPERWRERLSEGTPEAPAATWAAVDPEGRFLGAIAAATVHGRRQLFAMWVAPEHRRAGLGRELLRTAIAWADALRPPAPLYLDVVPEAVAAVRLYEAFGFRFTGASEPLDARPELRALEMVRAPGTPGR